MLLFFLLAQISHFKRLFYKFTFNISCYILALVGLQSLILACYQKEASVIDKIFALIENFWSLITEVPKFRVFFSFGLIVLALLLGLIVVLWRFSHTSQSNASSLNLDDETPEDDDIFASSTNYHDEINIQQSLQDEWIN